MGVLEFFYKAIGLSVSLTRFAWESLTDAKRPQRETAIVQALRGGTLSGRELQDVLRARRLGLSMVGFYKLMADMEDAGKVGRRVEKIQIGEWAGRQHVFFVDAP